MSTQFAQDLRLARRKAGFTQQDIAQLLSAHQSIVSGLEHGKLSPSLEQIITLSLIYGRSFEAFFAEVMERCRQELIARADALPPTAKQTAETFNRPVSLERLKRRLAEPQDHGGA